MKRVFRYLKGGGSSERPPPSVVENDKAADGPRLNQPLSQKIRHSSLMPGSFFEREARFKGVSSQKPGREKNTAVLPRTEGPCEFKQGIFGSWAPVHCRIKGPSLLVLPPNSDAAATPLKYIQLVGSHLAAGKHPTEFSITDPSSAFTFRTASGAQRDEWMVGLGGVPGLFRRVEDYYVLGRTWGHGATSIVTECSGRFSGKRMALKRRLHSTREATAAMHNELRILQICAKKPHPAIPTLEDFFFDTSGRIELVIELMQGGELFDWIAGRERITEADAQAVFRQVVSGVAHLHSMGIAHRDLKPQNLMYVAPSEGAGEGSSIKIMDYDLAKVNHSPEWEGSTPCGTMHYMAPEVVRGERYSLAVDCWSLGVILYILLSGRMPFHEKTDEQTEAAIAKGEYRMGGEVMGAEVSDEAKDMVMRLLRMDPAERLTAEQCLQHPWLAAAPQTPENGVGLGEEAASLSAAAVAGLTLSSPGRSFSPERRLRTSSNLRQLSGTLSGAKAGASGGSRVGRAVDTLSALVGQEPPPQLHPSPLSKALDYDLAPVRRQAALAAGERDGAGPSASSEGDSIVQLRVALDLVGRPAGIVDNGTDEDRSVAGGNAYANGDGGSGEIVAGSGSPAVAAEMVHGDSFADLDAVFVEEEENEHEEERINSI